MPPVNTQWPWRDGVGTIEISTDKILMFGGWNPNSGVFTPGPSTNQVWISEDGGLNWTYIGEAPWFRRHSFGHSKIGNYIYIFGGDPFYDGNAPKDVWRCYLPDENYLDWEQVTNNWGTDGGNRLIFAHCEHKGNIYMAGGQHGFDSGATAFSDICVLNQSTGQFSKVGDLPITWFSTGAMVSNGDNIYIFGGGRYQNSGHDNFNSKIYKSSDNGVTWTELADLPTEFNGLMYCGGSASSKSLFFVNGSDGFVNHSGIWYTDLNAQLWLSLANPTATHAPGITNYFNNHFYIISGNETNYVLKINKD